MATHSGILAWRIPWGHKFLDVQFFALISSLIVLWLVNTMGFPGGSDSKESACSAGNLGSVPGMERSPGEGNGYSLQYSYQEKSMDRGALWAAHGVSES